MRFVIALVLLLAVAGAAYWHFVAGPVAQPSASDPAIRGAELFVSMGCQGCHGEDGIPLANVPAYSDDDIKGIFANPPAGMPVMTFAPGDDAAVIAYLRQRFKE